MGKRRRGRFLKFLIFFWIIFPAVVVADFTEATAGWSCVYDVTLFHPFSERYLFTGDFCIENNVHRLVRRAAVREKTSKNFSIISFPDRGDYVKKAADIRPCDESCAFYSLNIHLPGLKEVDIKILVIERHETDVLETYLSPQIELSEIDSTFFAKSHDITLSLNEGESLEGFKKHQKFLKAERF